MASSTSTTGTRQSRAPSGASHSSTRWTWVGPLGDGDGDQGGAVAGERPVKAQDDLSVIHNCGQRVGATFPGAIGEPGAVQRDPLAQPVAAKGVLPHLGRQGRPQRVAVQEVV